MSMHVQVERVDAALSNCQKYRVASSAIANMQTKAKSKTVMFLT